MASGDTNVSTLDLVESDLAVTGAADTIDGGSEDDIAIGGFGADVIRGSAGNDLLLGDNGRVANRLGVRDYAETTDIMASTGDADDIDGGSENDVVLAGAGADVVRGGTGDDILVGDNGRLEWLRDADARIDRVLTTQNFGAADTLSGNAGADVMLGGYGGDAMYGDDATASAGVLDLGDVMLGDNGQIDFSGGMISRAASTDTGDTTGGVDTIFGNAGDDRIAGGVLGDTLQGNAGNDVVLGDNGVLDWLASGDTNVSTLDVVETDLTVTGAADTIDGGSEDDIVLGGFGGDGIAGMAGRDLLIGDNGRVVNRLGVRDYAETTDGMASTGGNDDIDGGADDDIVLAGAGSDVVRGGLGNDIIAGDNARVDWLIDSDARIDRVLTTQNFGAADTLSGNAGADVMLGGYGGDAMYGDDATASAGAADSGDVLLGDNGQIDYTGGVISRAATTDTGTATGGIDTISGNAGDDKILGGVLGDTLYGDAASAGTADLGDVILGDNGQIDFTGGVISRALTTDTTAATGGVDVISGNAGDDAIAGGALGDTIRGNTGNDVIFGDNARMDFVAGALVTVTTTDNGLGGADTIRGDEGQDALAGGADSDRIDGGTERDLIFGDSVALDRTTGDQGKNARFEALSGSQIYSTASGTAGNAQVDGKSQSDPTGTPAWETFNITLLDHSATVQDNPQNRFGNDYIAGGADNDQIFGELGNDTIQGDGSIDFVSALYRVDPATGAYVAVTGSVPADIPGGTDVGAWRSKVADPLYNSLLYVRGSSEASTDGDDYIEGGGGDDVVFGNLGQDDILGGSSSLFSLDTPAKRPDGSDLIFGGAGVDISRNNIGDAKEDPITHVITTDATGHARDADTIIGDNGNIYRLVGTNGTAGAYLGFNYDNYGPLKIVARATTLIDYTPGGPDYKASASADIGAADEIHGESGDDFIYGGKGSDVIFGEGQDDDIIGGYGNDRISGGTGQDGVIGDDGRIFTSRNGTAEPLYGIVATTQGFVSTPGNVQQADLNVTGELKKAVDLSPFSQDPNWQATADEFNGVSKHTSDDIIYGGLGSDWLHGGSGDDALSGAEALASFYARPANAGNVLGYDPQSTEFAAYDEFNPRTKIAGFLLNFDEAEGVVVTSQTYGTVRSDGDDKIFGDNSNDWLVGGTGRDDLYGGWGDDLLNADDNQNTTGGTNDAPDTHPSYEDRAYGGAGRDVLIGNTGGDRLIDWVGEFNSFIVPFAPFGLGTVSRALQPQIAEFLYALSASDGADFTRAADTGADPVRNGEPFGELGAVRQQDQAWHDQTGGPRDPQAGNLPGGPRDVLRSASFDDPSAPLTGFAVDSGTWNVQDGVLQVSATSQHSDAVAVYQVGDALPTYFEVLGTLQNIKPTSGWNANSYVIFDYVGKTDFKFAGIDVSTNKVVMGHRDASGWVVDKQASFQGSLKSDTNYNAFLSVNGLNATITIDNKTSLTMTYAPRVIDGFSYGLNWGLVGMGSNNSRGAFDNVRVQVAQPETTYQSTEDFTDGVADLFTGGSSGVWSVAGGRFTASGSGAFDLIDLPVVDRLSADAVLDLTTTVNTQGRAGFVFDRYSADNFKFVAVDAVADQIIIGHYTKKSGWVNDAVVSKPIDAGVDYTLGVSLKGSTVSVTLNGQAMVGFAYNAVTVDGYFGLIAVNGATSFDDVKVKTTDRAFAGASGASMLAADVVMTESASTLTQADLDAAAAQAMSAWTQALGSGDPRLGGFGEVRITVGQLAGDELGYTAGRTVAIDADAAGHGWAGHGGSMDLVTVVEHEMGHLLGFDHGDAALYPVMREDLQSGMQYLLQAANVDPDAPLTDATLLKIARKAVELNFDLGGFGGGSDAQVNWHADGANAGWTSVYSPYAAPSDPRGGNFTDYLLKPGVGADTAPGGEYDPLGKSLVGKRSKDARKS
jgi:Ca2+-binding RTX toxin-like protein